MSPRYQKNFIELNKNFDLISKIEAERNSHSGKFVSALGGVGKALTEEEKTVVHEILTYWYPPSGWDRQSSLSPQTLQLHWSDEINVDNFIRKNFERVIDAIAKGRCEHWIKDHYACLAYVICCDVFTRRIYRGTHKAFMLDRQAQIASKSQLVNLSSYKHAERITLLLPLVHSEDLNDVSLAHDTFDSE